MRNNIKRGKYLKMLRTEAKLSQEKLAEKLKVDRAYISRWENGEKMKNENLNEISKFYGIPKDIILSHGKLSAWKEFKNLIKNHILQILSFIIVILIILLIFFVYYFINNFNSVKLYDVMYEDNNYLTIKNTSYLFKAKDKVILSLNIDYNIKPEEVEKIAIKVLRDGKEKEISSFNFLSDVKIIDKNTDPEYFDFTNIDNELKNLLLAIELKTGEKYQNHLQFNKYYQNNKVFYKPNKSASVKYPKKEENKKPSQYEDKIKKVGEKLASMDLEAIEINYQGTNYMLYYHNGLTSVTIHYKIKQENYILSYDNIEYEFFHKSKQNKHDKINYYDVYSYSITDNKCISDKGCDGYQEDIKLFDTLLDKILQK